MTYWIKCSDRMPEIETDVLIYQKGYTIYLSKLIDDYGHIIWKNALNKYVTHWMPLPPAPKDDE